MVDPGARSDTHRFHSCAADLPPTFPTCLASPFVYYRNDVEPLIPCPGGTARQPHDRWQNLPTRGAPADHREDRRGPTLYRGADKSDSGIRTSEGSRWALRTHRVVIHVHDSCDIAGFAHGKAGQVDDRQSDRPAWCHDWQAILVCPAPGGCATQ